VNNRTLLVGQVSLLMLAPCLAHCRRDSKPEPASNPIAAAAPPVAPSVSAPDPAAQVGPLGPGAAAEKPFSGQDQRAGKWIETSAYKFRVNGVQRCADPVPKEPVPEDRPLRVGVKVEVFSKYDNFLLAGRDVTIEKGGVIINSERTAKASAGCAPVLQPTHMKHDQTAGGVVVFQVPDESYVREGSVGFEPTRWGGAPRTEVKLSAADFISPSNATSAAPAKN
jgi:hypothetical protein